MNRSFRLSIICLLSTTILSAPAALAQERGGLPGAPSSSYRATDSLSLDDAFRHAYANNPDLQAAMAENRAVHELYPQAVAGWRPTLNAEASIYASDVDSSNFGRGDGATTKDLSLSLDQPIYRGGRTTAETARARHLIAASDARLREMQQVVFFNVAAAYMNVLRDQALLNIQQSNVSRLQTEFDAARERFSGGDVTRTDVSQAEARLAAAHSGYIAATAALEGSRAGFERETGFLPSSVMYYPTRDFGFPATLEEMIREAEENNPRLTSLEAQHEAALQDIKRNNADSLPQVSAFASYNQQYDPQPGIIDEAEVRMIGLRARLALYQGGADRARVREAKHTAMRRQYEAEGTRYSLREEITRNWRQYNAAMQEISARQKEVESTGAARDGVSEEARMGERTILDILDADQEILNAEAGLVRARYNAVLSSHALAASLGYLTPARMGIADDAAPGRGMAQSGTPSSGISDLRTSDSGISESGIP